MPLRRYSLTSFGTGPCSQEVVASLSFDHQGLSIAYYLTPPNKQISWPSGVATRQDNLWQDTCFELFCQLGNGPEYVEFNFAPNGPWNAYHFTDYRQNMRPLTQPLTVATTSIPGTWLRATVNWQITGPIAISAITRCQTSGHFTYWALLHTQGRPDFHHPQGFLTIC